jgi:hypothetical protein
MSRLDLASTCTCCSHGPACRAEAKRRQVDRAGLGVPASTAADVYCRTNLGLAVTHIGHGPQARSYIAAAAAMI